MGYKQGFLDYPDRVKIRFRLNKNTNRTNAVMIHGLGERLEMYDYLYPYFERSGIALSSVELRGHGESSGKHKFIQDFELYIRDLKRLLFGYLRNRSTYLIGHNIGAMIALRTAEDIRMNISGLILTSPVIDLKINSFQRFLIPVLSRIIPHFMIPDKDEDYRLLTHVEENVMMLMEEGKRTLYGVYICLLGALLRERIKFLRKSRFLKNVPLLIFLADDDSILDTGRTGDVFNRIYKDSDNLDIINCNNCYHAVLLEKKRLDYLDKIIRWIDEKEHRK